ncbi:hypothetical protein [Absidia glauca]|uniref:Late embryogenesis abundant protein LEA-2 subgroup domain-containing protein n=1 Tax=Absidia glauca TaxID=4829 RepID=A0A163JAX9_ABSGL|nr:hypothetical protein [Absidia glauca]
MMDPSPPPPVPPHYQHQQHYPYIQSSPTVTAVSQQQLDDDKHKTAYDSTPSTIAPPVFDDRDMESANEKPPLGRRKRPLKERGCCVRCCCCACLPRWAAYAVWALIIAIIIVVIVLASIFATFKMPTFGFVGLASAPDGGNSNTSASAFTLSGSDFSVTNGEFSFRFGLEVNVNNPNIFPLHFSNMNATAYYPSDTDPDVTTPIGGGFLESQWIPAKTNLTFTYPFQIDYDPSLDSDQSVLSSLTDKCGLTGDQAQDLSIDYTIQLAASALFVTIHPTIASSAQFPCPLNIDPMPMFMVQGQEYSPFQESRAQKASSATHSTHTHTPHDRPEIEEVK